MPPVADFVLNHCQDVTKNPNRVIRRLKAKGFDEPKWIDGASGGFSQTAGMDSSVNASVLAKKMRRSDAPLILQEFGYPLQTFLYGSEQNDGVEEHFCGGLIHIGLSEKVPGLAENPIVDGLLTEFTQAMNSEDKFQLDEKRSSPQDNFYVWREIGNSNVSVTIERVAPLMIFTIRNSEI